MPGVRDLDVIDARQATQFTNLAVERGITRNRQSIFAFIKGAVESGHSYIYIFNYMRFSPEDQVYFEGLGYRVSESHRAATREDLVNEVGPNEMVKLLSWGNT